MTQTTIEVAETYAKALSEIRDMFPVPERGDCLEQAWAGAMTAAEYVPTYVKACVEKMQHDNRVLTAATLQATSHIIRDVAKKFDIGGLPCVIGNCTPDNCLNCRV
jgi:hypothetical protein